MDRLDHGPGHEPDDGQSPMRDEDTPSIGAELRDTRLELGLELADISSALRIRRVYLEAIEAGQFDQLPGTTYAIGFVRVYADHLGLDGNEVVRCFKEEVSGLGRKTDLAFPVVITESRIPRGAILLISALLVVTAYGGWYYLSAKGISISEIIPEVPKKLASMISGDTPEPLEQDPATKDEGGTTGTPVPEAAPDAAAGQSSVASPPVKEEKAEVAAETVEPAMAAGTETAAAPENTSPPEPAATSAPEPSPRTEPAAASAPEPAPRTEPAATSAPEPSPPTGSAVTVAETAPGNVASTEAPAAPPPAPSPPTALAIEPAFEPAPVENLAARAAARSALVALAPAEAPEATSRPETTIIESQAAPATRPGRPVGGVPEIPGVPRQSAALPERQPRVYGEGNSDSRVIVRATRDSWIQVHGADNVLLLTRILRAGDSYRVPNRNGLTLMTGNAGALEIFVDGEPVPPIGPFGAVRRNISLDANRLKSGPGAAN